MTIIDYEKYWIANMHKQAKRKDSERQLLATIMNFGGMGVQKYIKSEELIPIPLIDVENIILPIRDIKEAMKVFKMILNEEPLSN